MSSRSKLPPYLRLLGHGDRRAILFLLGGKSLPVREIARSLNLNVSSVHYHVHRLFDSGLLDRDASATPNLYRLSTRTTVRKTRRVQKCTIHIDDERLTITIPRKN